MPNIIIKKSKNKRALLSYGDRALFNCVIGKKGITANKMEGDWKTPAGTFSILKIYFRKDKVKPFKCSFKLMPIERSFGWCDDPKSIKYNKFVEIPFADSFENLWREDNLYDIVVVLDYNMKPTIKGKGSAIFIHTTKPNMKYTKGCVALKQEDLIKLLGSIKRNTKITIIN